MGFTLLGIRLESVLGMSASTKVDVNRAGRVFSDIRPV